MLSTCITRKCCKDTVNVSAFHTQAMMNQIVKGSQELTVSTHKQTYDSSSTARERWKQQTVSWMGRRDLGCTLLHERVLRTYVALQHDAIPRASREQMGVPSHGAYSCTMARHASDLLQFGNVENAGVRASCAHGQIRPPLAPCHRAYHIVGRKIN